MNISIFYFLFKLHHLNLAGSQSAIIIVLALELYSIIRTHGAPCHFGAGHLRTSLHINAN